MQHIKPIWILPKLNIPHPFSECEYWQSKGMRDGSQCLTLKSENFPCEFPSIPKLAGPGTAGVKVFGWELL